jgi:hypothetical protein
LWSLSSPYSSQSIDFALSLGQPVFFFFWFFLTSFRAQRDTIAEREKKLEEDARLQEDGKRRAEGAIFI